MGHLSSAHSILTPFFALCIYYIGNMQMPPSLGSPEAEAARAFGIHPHYSSDLRLLVRSELSFPNFAFSTLRLLLPCVAHYLHFIWSSAPRISYMKFSLHMQLELDSTSLSFLSFFLFLSFPLSLPYTPSYAPSKFDATHTRNHFHGR